MGGTDLPPVFRAIVNAFSVLTVNLGVAFPRYRVRGAFSRHRLGVASQQRAVHNRAGQ